MKKITRVLSLACSFLIACTMMAGCGKGGNEGGGGGNKPGRPTLTMRLSNTGYKTECLKAVANQFAKIENCNVKFVPTVMMESDLAKLDVDYKMEDIFFVSGTDRGRETLRKRKFLQIDDVWNATPEGEDKPIKDKVFKTFRDDAYKADDGHYYALPYETQLGGFAYNKTTLDGLYGEGNWSLPTTTDGLKNMAKDVAKKGAWGMTFTGSQPYWTLAYETWTAQYHGLDTYTHLINGEYKKDDGTWEFSQNGECLDQTQGQLRTFEAVYELMNKDNGMVSEYCDTMDFMQMQISFAGLGYKPADEKKVAFTPTGAWLYSENSEDFNYAGTTPGFFNVVLSGAVERLSFYNEKGTDFYKLAEAKRNNYDKALNEIIVYVDKVIAGENPEAITTANGYPVTAEDISAVTEMRKLRYVHAQPLLAIAHNSKNIELAKKFLKFFASDTAGAIYSSNTHGVTPFCYNKRQLTSESPLFDRDVNRLLADGNAEILPSKIGKPYDKLAWCNVEGNFYNNNISEVNTADTMYEKIFIKSNKSNWKKIVRESGNGDLLK